MHGCPLLGKTYNKGEEGMDLCKIIEKLISIYSTLIPTTKRARKNYTPPPNIKKRRSFLVRSAARPFCVCELHFGAGGYAFQCEGRERRAGEISFLNPY